MPRGSPREESRLQRDALLRRIIAAVTLAGAAIGLITSARQALSGDIAGIGWPVTAAFVLVYGAGLVAGVLLLGARPRAVAFALPYWLAQVPVLSSSVLGYYFGAGANLYLTVGSGGRIDVDWFIGTHFGVSVGATGETLVGLNVVAAAVFAWMLAAGRNAPREREG